MNVISQTNMSANAMASSTTFNNDRVITIHTGQFGINFARSLYSGCKDPLREFQPLPILCDLDRDCIDEVRC